MADFVASQQVAAPVDQLFGYLADVRNLPGYVEGMTGAQPTGGQRVRTRAEVDGRTYEGEAWFRVHEAERRIEWGAEGPSGYHGELDVSGDALQSSVTVRLHTERARADDPEATAQVEQGIEQTLRTIRQIVETQGGPIGA